MSGTVYNVVLNSIYGTGANNSKTYFFDWNLLPRGSYEVSFSYIGEVNNLNGSSIAILYMDIGQYNNFEVLTNYRNGSYLGYIKPYVISTTSYLYSNNGENGTTTITNNPSNNNITINIYNNHNPQVLYTDNATNPNGNYILNLQMIFLG